MFARHWALIVLLPVVAGCYDREKCTPVAWGPVGNWHFIAPDNGAVMANRLFDGWQKVKGCCEPGAMEFEFDGGDRPWLMVAGSAASYGLRFSTATTGTCNPEWATVSIDGERMVPRVKRRTIFEDTCLSPHGCPEDSLNEEVDDVIWDWTPATSGYSTLEFQWGNYKRSLRMLVAEAETESPVAEIPARCRRVQRVDESTWLCDRQAFRNGVAIQSWSNTSLLASLGAAAVLEWGENRIRLWRFDGGSAAVTLDMDAGVSPQMRWDGGQIRYLDRDDIFVLDGGQVVLDAAREVLFLDDALGAAPQLARREFGAQVASVHGQPVSVIFLGDGTTNVCRGLDVSDCQLVQGIPVAAGEDGVWFVNGNWWAASVGYVGSQPFVSTIQMAEDAVYVQHGMIDFRGGRLSEDAGEPLEGRLRRVKAETRQGGCLFYDVHLDGGLIPRIYPEVGELEPPFVSWQLPQSTSGDGEGEWRWCVKLKAGITSVYRAPRE